MVVEALELLAPVREELHAAGAWHGDFVLFGSSVMMLHGLRESVGDIDVFVKPWLWGELVDRGWTWRTPRAGDPPFAVRAIPGTGVETHAFFAWDERHDHGDIVAAAFAGQKVYEGWPCQPLEQLREWKSRLWYDLQVHPKHRTDVDLIDAYLSRATA